MGITCIEMVILVPTRGGTLLNRIGRREEVMRFFLSGGCVVGGCVGCGGLGVGEGVEESGEWRERGRE